MEPDFWHDKWEKNIIGFHQNETNPFLVQFFKDLSLEKGDRVFVPLCGKTLDIAWLLSNGYRVAGAELSELAIGELFKGLGLEPEVSTAGELKHYSAKNIDIFAGDIFHLTREVLGPVDAVYDRAALVALPEAMRVRYVKHLMEITNKAPQLLITFEYDQQAMDGPPFSVGNSEVTRHYQNDYDLTLALSQEVAGGLKGKCAAQENVWLLKKI